MQLGPSLTIKEPSDTLHNTSVVSFIENPLVGYSEGERQRKLYKE